MSNQQQDPVNAELARLRAENEALREQAADVRIVFADQDESCGGSGLHACGMRFRHGELDPRLPEGMALSYDGLVIR